MKYIRTKVYDLILRVSDKITDEYGTYYLYDNSAKWFEDKIAKVADTIEDICDERVLSRYFEETDYTDYEVLPINLWELMAESVSARLKEGITDINYLGAIWTKMGLIHVAKLNDKGELELL